MNSHLSEKNIREWKREKRRGKVVIFVAVGLTLITMSVIIFIFFCPHLKNAPELSSGEEWESTDGKISFTMTYSRGDSIHMKQHGMIRWNGEIVPVLVAFRAHDPIMWIYKDTERVRAGSKGYRKDALLKYECKYWHGKFKATLIKDYTDSFNGDLDQLTFIRTKKGRQVAR